MILKPDFVFQLANIAWLLCRILQPDPNKIGIQFHPHNQYYSSVYMTRDSSWIAQVTNWEHLLLSTLIMLEIKDTILTPRLIIIILYIRGDTDRE
jgi:hypothetical protein